MKAKFDDDEAFRRSSSLTSLIPCASSKLFNTKNFATGKTSLGNLSKANMLSFEYAFGRIFFDTLSSGHTEQRYGYLSGFWYHIFSPSVVKYLFKPS